MELEVYAKLSGLKDFDLYDFNESFLLLSTEQELFDKSLFFKCFFISFVENRIKGGNNIKEIYLLLCKCLFDKEGTETFKHISDETSSRLVYEWKGTINFFDEPDTIVIKIKDLFRTHLQSLEQTKLWDIEYSLK